MSLPVLLVLTFVAAAASAAAAGLACRPLAHRIGVVARPRGDRWHQRPIPLLGGLALAAGTLAAVAPWVDPGAPLFVIVVGAAASVMVGLLDDLRPLKPQTKLTAQLLVAAAAVSTGLRLPVTGVIWLDVLVSLLWLVALSNAFNLLDNMDGLAAGVAAIAALAHAVLFAATGETAAAALAVALGGACVGFLVYNSHPASMFMGDAGSLFLGFTVGGLSLVASAGTPAGSPMALLLPALIVLVPIFDSAFVTVHRLAAGRPISQGGRDHASHRLVAAGFSERQAVAALYAAAGVSAVVALATARYGIADSGVAIGLLGVGVLLFGVFLGRVGGDTAAEAGGDHVKRRLPNASSYGRQAGAFAIDLLLVALAYYAAYRLRFEQTYAAEEPLFIASLPLVVAAKMVAFAMLRTYQGLWRHTSLADLVRLAQAVVLGEALAVLGILAVFRFYQYSRALFVVDAVLLFLFLGGSRAAARLMAEGLRPKAAGRKPVVIYGAGEAGLMVLREIRSNGGLGREAVAFVDDDPALNRTELHGLRVAGGADRLDDLLRTTPVAEVVVSSTKIAPERLAQVRDVCEAHGVTVVRSVLRFE
jgi:UDP-GlcNAc:undecaprenyl-phosphate/decaprenyl-phosphate GlcNAc-1-phosphate transferase